MAVYLSNINLSGNQLQNATLHPTATPPSSPNQGQIYFDTDTKDLWYYDNAVWAPVRVAGGVGTVLAGSAAAPVYDIDFTASSLSIVTTNTAADILAMYDDSVSGHRAITFGNFESNLDVTNMIGGGALGTVTTVTAGAGMTQTGGTSPDPVLNVISAAGTANTVGTLVVTANAVGVSLGTGSTDAAVGSHTHSAFDRATSVLSGANVFSDIVVTDGITTGISTRAMTLGNFGINATAGEINILDLSATALTAGWGYFADGTSSASWRKLLGSEIDNDQSWSTTTGTVTNVNDGNGMTFTAITGTGDVTLGTPSTVDGGSTNSVTSDSHTHLLDIEAADLTDVADIVFNDQANTYTGASSKQSFLAASTGTASIRIPNGVDPTTPVQGDVWMTGETFKYRDSTTVRSLIYAGGAFHDGFSDSVGNEHIDHTSVSITLTQTTNETSVTGSAQNIDSNVSFTVGIADNPIIPGTGGMIPVQGTTGQRVTRTGNFRYNTTDDIVEWYNGSGWDRPDVGGGEVNQNAFSIVTGDTGTASADAKSDTLAITAGTGLVTLGVAGAAAGLTINYDIANISNTATVSGDVILLGDVGSSSGIIKRDAATFITDQGIAKLASPTFTGDPTAPTPSQGDNDFSIATTAFVATAVAAASAGIDYKESSRAASTATVSVTYSATGGGSGRGRITAVTDTIDGVSLATNDRVLLKDQSAGAQNGIWEVLVVGTGSNGEWERADDFDEDAEVTAGAYTFIEEGTLNENSGWRLSTPDPIVIGGSSGTVLAFTQVSGAGQINAGDGLSKDGNTLDVNPDTANSSIAIVSDEVRIDTSWIGQAAITTVGTLTSGSIGVGFTAIIDARLATITTSNKVSGSAVQLSTDSAIENSTGLRLKSNIAGDALTLVNSGGNQVLNVASATIAIEGTVELATVAEAEAKTDTDRAVTPAGLATFGRKSAGNIGNGAATAIQYTHSLGTNDVIVQLWSNTTDDMVFADIDRHDADSDIVTITFASAPASNDIRVIVIG